MSIVALPEKRIARDAPADVSEKYHWLYARGVRIAYDAGAFIAYDVPGYLSAGAIETWCTENAAFVRGLVEVKR